MDRKTAVGIEVKEIGRICDLTPDLTDPISLGPIAAGPRTMNSQPANSAPPAATNHAHPMYPNTYNSSGAPSYDAPQQGAHWFQADANYDYDDDDHDDDQGSPTGDNEGGGERGQKRRRIARACDMVSILRKPIQRTPPP